MDNCPAIGKTCKLCSGINHLAKVCFRSGNVEIKRPQLNRLDKGRESDTSDSEYEASATDTVRQLHNIKQGMEVYVKVCLNGTPVEMLYDTGASKSIISEKIWRKIGNPILKKAPNLLAYTGVKVETLGTMDVEVNAFGKRIVLPVAVARLNDLPLFGINWILKFGLTLPEGCNIRQIQDNVLVVRSVRTFKQRMKAATGTKDKNVRLQNFLLSNHTTPQKTTQRTPAEVIFKRDIRHQLHLLKMELKLMVVELEFLDDTLVRQKVFHDKGAKLKDFEEGDKVWITNTDGKEYKQGLIRRQSDEYSYKVEVNGIMKRKHADQLKKRICAEQETKRGGM
ncbi:hypothetical protein GE061_003018 [Apolygus lucorum]|uniref:Peptidase A2 domain-containing protein n=1 Tax=Apolygus lucorum TaxID=248454 RepID=A0A8S9X2C6_APOLU|nr:hypothetical protein GE061_003018 [Apolygus lucorum]